MNRLIEVTARLLVTISAVVGPCASLATDVLPQPEPRFKGKIGATLKDSVPDWSQPPKAPINAPNIILILLDDIGFADTSTFGGVAQTPELDRLSAQGLRYINFNVTGTCSPTRAALLSGRNHHRVGFGVAEGSGGFPGYDFVWKKSTASVADVLRRNGYSTGTFGKWHNTPYYEVSPAGPFDRWPTGLGFEHFYGFIAGVDNQWEPSSLFRNTTPVAAPATPEQGYHFTTDITDQAIGWLGTHESLSPEKPYLLYFSTGAVHWPHHAPKQWVDKYRGSFDQGWDKLREQIFARQKQLGVVPVDAELTPRPKEILAWDSLSPNQKRLYARQMEVYAGFVAHTDFEIGRLLRAAQQGPRGDNTLILYIVGDNGSNGENGMDGFTNAASSVEDQLKQIDELGSPAAWNQYSAGWAWLGSTPFQWWKWIASHFGATRAPLIISWPARISRGGSLRKQFTHVTDVAATIYELTGIHFPSTIDGVKQQPLDGVSFAQTLHHADAVSHHHTQYFEMVGNRAIYHDGWMAAARHRVAGFQSSTDADFPQDRWELYRVEKDFSQVHDLAAQFPGQLKKLQKLFDIEARKNDVYPLNGASGGGPSLIGNKREFVYYAGMPRLQRRAMPPLAGTSYGVTAHAVIPDTGAQGVILSYGARGSGFAFYLKGDRLIYENNREGAHETIASEIPVPRGEVVLAFKFTQVSTSKGIGLSKATSSGTGRLFINGQVVGEANLTTTLGARYAESMGVSEAFGSPVSNAFQPPFKFTGTLQKVTVSLE